MPTKTVHVQVIMYNVCAFLLNFTWIMVDRSWILFPAVLHASSANLPESPDYNTVLKMLKDVSETLFVQTVYVYHSHFYVL